MSKMKIMKTLKTKFNHVTSIMMMILLIISFSCDRDNEEQENQEIIESENLNEEEMVGSQSPVTQGSLQKKFEVQLEEASYLISLSTDNKEIFESLNEKSVTGELLFVDQVDQKENTEDINSPLTEKEEDDNVNKNSDEHFISIYIKEIKQSDTKSLKVTLSDNLIRVLKKYKAKTIIHHEYNDDQTKAFNLNTNGFVAYGDGGVVKTKLKIYYKYSSNGTVFSSTTRYGFLNDYTFRSCEWPTRISSRCRYTRFVVTQDVLTSYIPFNTSKCKKC